MRIAAAKLAVCLCALSCETGGVGDPCVPVEEYSATFSGFTMKEANVESSSFSCATRVCLVNHFQGRVSCPDGQTADAAASCTIPGTSEAVTVAVEPWDLDRPATRAVYCSCRCDGPDRDANYCECPSGYTCSEIVPQFDLGRKQLEGSYCIKRGTAFNPIEVGGATCRSNPEAPECASTAE